MLGLVHETTRDKLSREPRKQLRNVFFDVACSQTEPNPLKKATFESQTFDRCSYDMRLSHMLWRDTCVEDSNNSLDPNNRIDKDANAHAIGLSNKDAVATLGEIGSFFVGAARWYEKDRQTLDCSNRFLENTTEAKRRTVLWTMSWALASGGAKIISTHRAMDEGTLLYNNDC